MSEFEIHIPARKKQAIAEKDAAVKVTGEAYNALTEIYNESTLLSGGVRYGKLNWNHGRAWEW